MGKVFTKELSLLCSQMTSVLFECSIQIFAWHFTSFSLRFPTIACHVMASEPVRLRLYSNNLGVRHLLHRDSGVQTPEMSLFET
jgi:hypothetical protein